MHRIHISLLLIAGLLIGTACQQAVEEGPTTTVTLLFTNDVESAYDPIPAFWLDDQDMIGGIAEMTTLIKTIRQIFVTIAGTDVAFIHSGSLRKDLPGGDVRVVDLLDSYPFVDDVVVKEMSGEQIRRALEQSFTLERGLLQVSGLQVVYDTTQPQGQRLVSVEHGGAPLADVDRVTVAVPQRGRQFDVAQ